MFRFDPLTEEEIQLESLIPEGVYDFSVLKAEQKDSKKGIPMIELLLEIYMPDGGKRLMRDWLSASPASMAKMKINLFCYCVGLGSDYEQGFFDERKLPGRSGKVSVGIEKSKDPQYPEPKNRLHYIKEPKKGDLNKEKLNSGEEFDNDIPF